MHVSSVPASLRGIACLLVLAGMASAQTHAGPNAAGANAGSNSPVTTAGPDAHLPPTNAKLNGLAHRLLQAGLKANALSDENLAPWHIKIDYQMRNDPNPKLASGTVVLDYAGQTVSNEMDGTVNIEVTVAPDQKLIVLLKTGTALTP